MDGQNVNLRGLVDNYDFPCTLPSGKELKIKPITTARMKSVLAYENETDPLVIEDALDDLIKSCVVSEDFNLDELYLQDRFFLLMELRKISKGASYAFSFKCPRCGLENIKNVDLSELEVKPYYIEDSVVKLTENISFKVDFPDRGVQKQAMGMVDKSLPLSTRMAEITMVVFALSVKEVYVNGEIEEASFDDILYILNNIPTSVFDEFKQWFDDNDFGVVFKTSVTCNNNDYKHEMEIPLEGFFG